MTDDDQDLRRRALAALRAGVLPHLRPQRTWGGSGTGELCPVCGRNIEPEDMELELDFASADCGNTGREFHLHLRCFAAWEVALESASHDRA
jgi:hypothetical protein